MSFSWQGATGEWFEFDVARALRVWESVGGVFMFVRPGDGATYEAFGPLCLYIEETANLADALARHIRWDAAKELGAAEIHLRVEPDAAKRARLFADLLKAQSPVLNRHAARAA